MPDPTGSGSKKPRFFCESCGEEVPRDGKKCPKCGKFFSSVRCPACGFIGDDSAFKGGCPICGYSSTGSTIKKTPPDNRRPADALPFWVYILTAAVFTAVIAALFFRVF